MASTTTLTTCRVSVVGLSGKDKGSSGVGKSCLCNRFVRPALNDFRDDHISQVSPSDFSSLVINNQHFLYWGSVTKQVALEGDRSVVFEIVEQTEFQDDTSFKTFGDQGGMAAYIKRAAQVKLSSSGKLAYINKDQLALPTEYPMDDFPAKFTVDGFLVVVDVSPQQDRAVDTQPRLLTKLLPSLTKLKKPIIVVANKYDSVNDKLLEDLEAVVSKHGKGIPIILTSARDAINVDAAFFLLEQLVDRSSRSSRFLKIPSYADASRARQEQLDTAKRRFQSLLDAKVTNFTLNITWFRVHKLLKEEPDFDAFLELGGTPAARKAVIQHVKRLKEDRRGEVLTGYQQRLPEIFAEAMPSVPEGCTWEQAKELIRESPEFERHFVVLADEVRWDDDDCLVSSDSRIPTEMLEWDFAKNLFESHKRKLLIQAEQHEVASELREILEDCESELFPGMTWIEASDVLRNSHPDYKPVPETVALPTFIKFDEDLRETCRKEFHELLLEHIDVFDLVADVAMPTNEHVRELEKHLQNKTRYKRLQRCPDDRSTLLWRVVASRQKPQLHSEICLAIGRLPSEQTWMSPENKWFLAPDETQLNLILLGSEQLPCELETELRGMMEGDELHVNKRNYHLRLEVVNSETVTAENFTPDDFAPQGVIGIFSTVRSVTYLEEVLTGLMLHGSGPDICDQSLLFKGLPIVLIYAADHEEAEADQAEVQKAGQRLSQRLQAPTLLARSNSEGTMLTPLEAVDSVSLLLDCIHHRHTSLYGPQPLKPDLKIALCCLEQDPISAERILGPFLRHQCCWRPLNQHGGPTDTLLCELCIGDSLKVVQIKVMSSLSSQAMLRDPKHGYIVVHSAQRRASFNIARQILHKLPTIPKVLVSTHSSNIEDGSVEQDLLSAANTLALEKSASRLRAGPTFGYDELAFWSFTSSVWHQRHASLQKQQPPSFKPRKAAPPRTGPSKSKTLEPGLTMSKVTRHAYEDVPLPSNRAKSHRPHSIHLSDVTESSTVISNKAEYAPLTYDKQQGLMSTTTGSSDAWISSQGKPSDGDVSAYNTQQCKGSHAVNETAFVEESEYALPFKANSTKRTELLSTSAKPASSGKLHMLGRSKTVKEGRKDEAPLHTRLVQSASAEMLTRDSEYAVVLDAVKKLSPSPGPIQEDFYALPQDTLPRDISEEHQSEVSTTSPEASNVYALPQDVLKGSAGEVPPMIGSQHHQKSLSLPRPIKPHSDSSPISTAHRSVSETKSPEFPPLKHWAARSERRPSPRIPPKPLKTSQSGKDLSLKKAGEVMSPQEVFSVISEEAVSPQTTRKKPKLPKHVQQFQAQRWSRPVSSHQTEMTSCAALLHENTLAVTAESDDEPTTEQGLLRSTPENIELRSSLDELAAEERAMEKALADLMNGSMSLFDSSSGSQDLVFTTTPPPPPPLPPPNGSLQMDDRELAVPTPGLNEALRLRRKKSLTNMTLIDMKMPLTNANASDSEEEAPPPLPPKMYYDSDEKNPSEEEGGRPGDGEEEESRSSFTMSLHLLRGSTKGEKERRRAMKEQKELEKRSRDEEKKREKRRRKEEKEVQKKMSAISRESAGRGYFGVALEELPARLDGSKFPLFIEVCVDYIDKNGMTYEGIYRVPGSKVDVNELQEQFAQDPQAGICRYEPCVTVVASALKAFLRDLPEPLVPNLLLQSLLDIFVEYDVILDRQQRLRHLLTTRLAPLEYAIVEYFCRHLNRVSQYADKNKMAANNLSIVVWPSFFRPDMNANSIQMDIINNLQRVLTFVILHSNVIFGPEKVAPSTDDDFSDSGAACYASVSMDKIGGPVQRPPSPSDDTTASYASVPLWGSR